MLAISGLFFGALPGNAMPLARTGHDRTLLLWVGDTLNIPPRDPGAKPLNADTIRQDLKQRLQSQFDAAADPSSHLLSSARAKAADWGFVADHFAEIDRDNSGLISYGEIANYMDARSPLKGARKGKVEEQVQIVE
jgi:hypothetical protein